MLRLMIPHPIACAVAAAAVSAAAGLLVPRHAAAQAGGACPAFEPASVRFQELESPIRRDFSRSMRQLTGMPGRAPAPGGWHGGRALGLTEAQFSGQTQYQLVFETLPDRSVCGSLKALSVSFGYSRRIVYIARELPPESCIHGEVLAHEMQHVAIDDAVMRDFRPRLQQQIEAVVEQLRPVRARTSDQAANALRRSVEAVLNRSMQEFGHERDRRQARLDTAEEYTRVSNSCGGELKRYLGNRR